MCELQYMYIVHMLMPSPYTAIPVLGHLATFNKINIFVQKRKLCYFYVFHIILLKTLYK
jgi:hypothetical protein